MRMRKLYEKTQSQSRVFPPSVILRIVIAGESFSISHEQGEGFQGGCLNTSGALVLIIKHKC